MAAALEWIQRYFVWPYREINVGQIYAFSKNNYKFSPEENSKVFILIDKKKSIRK